MQWTVVAIAMGEGPGEGVSPSPGKTIPRITSLQAPAPSGRRGEGSHGDIQWEAVPGRASTIGFPERTGENQPGPGSFPGLVPYRPDRGRKGRSPGVPPMRSSGE